MHALHRPKFKKAAKCIVTGRAVTSHLASLKHAKSQPKDLDTQYDESLEKLYLNEWPDAVPQYEDNHR